MARTNLQIKYLQTGVGDLPPMAMTDISILATTTMTAWPCVTRLSHIAHTITEILL
jgi:hypothetical protein